MTKQNQLKLDILEMKVDQLKDKIENIEKILLNQNCTNDVVNLLTNLISQQISNNPSLENRNTDLKKNENSKSHENQNNNYEFLPRRFSTII